MRRIILPFLGICVLSATSCQKKTTEVAAEQKSSNNNYVKMQGNGPQQPQVLTVYNSQIGDCDKPGGDCLPEVVIWGQGMTDLQWWIYHRLKDIFGVGGQLSVSHDAQLGTPAMRQYFSDALGVTDAQFNQMNYKDFFKKLNPLLTNEQADKLFSERYTKVAFINTNNTLMLLVAPVGADATANPEFVLRFGAK